MRDFYEELWRRLPDDLEPPEPRARLDFLMAGVSNGQRVLDVGCGSGRFTTALKEAGARVVGVDVAQAALERARVRDPDLDLRRVEFDGPLPFQDSAFDVVWASEVIEHVADTARWLSEIRRVLTPGGMLLLTTPSHGRLRLLLAGIERYSDPVGDHLHLYTRASLRRLLQDFGFEVDALRAAGGPPLLRRMLLARARR